MFSVRVLFLFDYAMFLIAVLVVVYRFELGYLFVCFCFSATCPRSV
jgi:hypothetical protein